jgi:2-dehydropantoate 2-reductase
MIELDNPANPSYFVGCLNRMKVAVLGCGSLGGVISGRLAGLPDIDLTVIDRDPTIAKAIETQGLTLWQGSRRWTHRIRLVEKPDKQCFDILILATKANSLVGAATALKEHLASGAAVVTVQNGLVALDVAEVVGAQSLIPGCVLWGASMEAPGEYRITNSGSFIIGDLDPSTASGALDRARSILSRVFPVTVSSHIRGVLWSKLAVTATFTTLGAITGLRFGKLAASREIRRLMLNIGRELYEVGRAEGIDFQPLGGGMDIQRFLSDDGYPRFLKHCLIRAIGYKNRHDESSMLDSMRRGFKTEIDFINGRVVQGADRAGIPVPFNRTAVDIVGEMERGGRRPGLANLAAFATLN